LTEGLRIELSDTQIHIVEIRPADINTPFHDQTKRIPSPANSTNEHRMDTVWETQLRNMAAAPPPDLVARAMLRAITALNPPPVTVVGGFFQARLAPLIARLAPLRLQEYVLCRYYRL